MGSVASGHKEWPKNRHGGRWAGEGAGSGTSRSSGHFFGWWSCGALEPVREGTKHFLAQGRQFVDSYHKVSEVTVAVVVAQ